MLKKNVIDRYMKLVERAYNIDKEFNIEFGSRLAKILAISLNDAKLAKNEYLRLEKRIKQKDLTISKILKNTNLKKLYDKFIEDMKSGEIKTKKKYKKVQYK